MEQRLDKLIASQGVRTRSEVRRLIGAGRVTVDGMVCRDAARKTDPDAARIAVDGKALSYAAFVYLMMNKPAGVLCVSRDPKVPTVVDLLPPELKRKNLFPAGRLDKDTVGLVILTDDGDFAHRMLTPKKEIVKCYHVTLDGPLSEVDVAAFATGITLADGTPCRPAKLTILENGPQARAAVYIHEGRYHQIKRMFGVIDRGVVFLKRVSIGKLPLDEQLAEGETRRLTAEEQRLIFDEN